MATFVSASATGGNGPQTVPAPANIAAGNLLLALIGSRQTGAIDTPAGWTPAGAGTDLVKVSAFYKYATATEPTSYIFNASTFMTATVLQYAGAAASDPVDVFAAVSQSTPTPSLPAVTTTAAGDLIVVSLYDYNGQTWTTPAGLTARKSFRSAGNESCYTWDLTQSSAGAAGPWTATSSAGGDLGLFTVAIKAAAAAGLAWSIWTGTAETPATLAGVWNGTTTVPGTASRY